MSEDYFGWADRHPRPRETVQDLEKTDEIKRPDPHSYEVKADRLSDTGRVRLFGAKP